MYRDLKPENIIISAPQGGRIKLVDFGFAKQLSKKEKMRTHTTCGTPAYVAPEIIRGKGHSFEVDVWSLGILLFEIIAGYTPFDSENTVKIYENIT